jgi:23S rRNA (uracil1939-C5)-methyltransferase
VTVRIDDLAPGGDGVGHVAIDGEGHAVFVPRACVGDVVEVAVDISQRPARAAARATLRLLERGPGRVAAPCAFFDACGACNWMHLSPATQRRAHDDHLRRALPRALRDVPIVLHDAGPALGYRTRARLHVRASGGAALVGPHGTGSHHIVDVGSCLVLDPRLDAALPLLRSLLDGTHGSGEASVALGLAGRPVLELRWEGRFPSAAFGRLEAGVRAGAWAGASVYLDDVARPAVVGDPAPVMMAADGEPLRMAVGGFAQASDAANLAMGQRVVALAEDALGARAGPTSVLELYAGAGNLTVLLARNFDRVAAVEASAPACEAARANLAARGLRARVSCADADSFAIPARTDLVVLDPPRRGAREASITLGRSSAKAIVYVSCDPATLGRDLAALAARFDVIAIESFAMFPGTSHSETVVALRRSRPTTSGGAS